MSESRVMELARLLREGSVSTSHANEAADAIEAIVVERDRLRAALETIANTIDGFEGRGDYVTYVSFSLDIADIARKAAKHREETHEA